MISVLSPRRGSEATELGEGGRYPTPMVTYFFSRAFKNDFAREFNIVKINCEDNKISNNNYHVTFLHNKVFYSCTFMINDHSMIIHLKIVQINGP